MTHIWQGGPTPAPVQAALDGLDGVEASDAASADVWLLFGELDAAREMAADARPDQTVLYLTSDAPAAAWSELGVAFDESIHATVTEEAPALAEAATEPGGFMWMSHEKIGPEKAEAFLAGLPATERTEIEKVYAAKKELDA